MNSPPKPILKNTRYDITPFLRTDLPGEPVTREDLERVGRKIEGLIDTYYARSFLKEPPPFPFMHVETPMELLLQWKKRYANGDLDQELYDSMQRAH